MLTLFLRTFGIGVAIAAPVGAMGVLCIRRTLDKGWWAGMATGLGIASADAIYAATAAVGIVAASDLLAGWGRSLRAVGGVALVWLGARAVLARPPEKVRGRRGSAGLYVSAVLLTLTNPMTIMAFAAVFASAGLAGGHGWRDAAVMTAGVGSGSLAWWTTLASGTALAGARMSPTAMTWVNRISGAMVALFGIAAIITALPR